MRNVSRFRRTAIAAAVGALTLAAGALVVVPTGPAAASGQTVAYYPDGPFTGGSDATITASGFAPNAYIIITECGSGVISSTPGMCASTQSGSAKLVQASAAGTAIATIKVTVGYLDNSTNGPTPCGPLYPCDFNATAVTNASATASVPIPFSADASPAPTVTVTVTATPPPGTPHVGFSPAGPFANGDVVTVTATGFAPNAPVAISECPKGRALLGPGDCGRSADGASKLVATDAAGKGVADLVIRTGPLGNQTPPAASCGYVQACVFNAINITDATEKATADIPYVIGDPALGFTPAGPFKAGARVLVSASGFTPTAPVVLLECAATRVPLGPGDCAPSSRGAQRLVTADAHGIARGYVTILTGPLLNQTPPATSCGPTRPCRFMAVNIAKASEQVQAAIPYAAGRSSLTVSIALNKSKVKRHTKVWFTGTVAANQASQRVYLQRLEGSRWVSKKSATLGMTSHYSVAWTPSSTTDYRWRVYIPATGFHYAAHSATRKLVVN